MTVRRHWRPLKSQNTIQLQEVVNNPSTMEPRIFVLKDGILAHLTEIWYNMRSEISSMYRWPFKLSGTMTRAVLPLKLIPAHIITLPPTCAVVGWTVGFKCLFPLRRHTRMRPSTFRRQNLDSSEKRTRDHSCRFHLPCRAHNGRLKAL